MRWLERVAGSLWLDPVLVSALVVFWGVSGGYTEPHVLALAPFTLSLFGVSWGLKFRLRQSRRAHARCADVAARGFANAGVEMHVSEVPPVVLTDRMMGVTCTHGRLLFAEPTGEQVALWRAAEQSDR